MSSRRVDPGTSAELRAVRIVEPDEGASAMDLAVERLRDEAHAEGVARGMEIAQEHAAKALADAVARLDAYREEAAASLAKTSVELAVEIARHLLCVEIEAGRHAVERIVRETLLASAVGRGVCVVHVHPDDAADLASATFRSGTRIEPDIGVKRGDVHVETPNGLFVRDLDDALAAIEERILETLR